MEEEEGGKVGRMDRGEKREKGEGGMDGGRRRKKGEGGMHGGRRGRKRREECMEKEEGIRGMDGRSENYNIHKKMSTIVKGLPKPFGATLHFHIYNMEP